MTVYIRFYYSRKKYVSENNVNLDIYQCSVDFAG